MDTNVRYVVVEGGSEETETKTQRFKRRFKEKFSDFGTWAKSHKNELVVLVTTTSVATRAVCKTVNRVVSARAKKARQISVYDRSENHHWFLRRQLNNAEWYEVQRRRKKGERLGDILEDMRALK